MRPLNLFGEAAPVFDQHASSVFIENQAMFVETKQRTVLKRGILVRYSKIYLWYNAC